MATAAMSDVVGTLEEIQAAAPRVLCWGDICTDNYITCGPSQPSGWNGARRVRMESNITPRGMAGAVCTAADRIGAKVVEVVPPNNLGHVRITFEDLPPLWIEEDWTKFSGERPDAQRLASKVIESLPLAQAVLISDYGRGAVTPAGLRSVIDAANAAGVPVLIDPHRQTDWERYRGASVIKCSSELWHSMDYDEADYLLETAVVVTEGGNGLRLFPADAAPGIHFPTEPIPNAYDCGAGDVVLAALGCAVAAGVDLARACRFANAVAGCKVRKLGPLSLSPGELRAALS